MTDELLTSLVDDLRALVEVESPSSDPDAVRAAGGLLAAQLTRRVGGEGHLADDGRLTWRSGDPGSTPGVLLLGHLDTVWPHGTLERLPFAVSEGRVTGPGVFDMKAGLVVAVHALARLREQGRLPPVELLVTPDEEVGASRSREAVLEAAARCRRVLVPEPSGPGGAVKAARKGTALGRLVVHGRAAHSGLDPEQGINAAVVLGRLLPEVVALSDRGAGTTVVPTLVRAGTAVNTVPARAEADLDVRFAESEEAERVRRGLATLVAGHGAELETTLEVNRGPLTRAATEPLLAVLGEAARAAGWPRPPSTVAVGGASDGNLAAGAGALVLDGLGPRGEGAHAEHEHVVVDDLVPRVGLLAELVARVAAG